jgi:hypothetical protein
VLSADRLLHRSASSISSSYLGSVSTLDSRLSPESGAPAKARKIGRMHAARAESGSAMPMTKQRSVDYDAKCMEITRLTRELTEAHATIADLRQQLGQPPSSTATAGVTAAPAAAPPAAPPSAKEVQEKTSWPELVGKDGPDAVAVIQAERADLELVTAVSANDMCSMDYMNTRVRVVVDADGKVTIPPVIG